MLAGLIRDDERVLLEGVPGLSDIPGLGRLFTRTRKEAQETDILLTLTPHIVRVLDLSEGDLRPFRVRSGTAAPLVDLPAPEAPPARDQPQPPEERPAAPGTQQPIGPITPPVPPATAAPLTGVAAGSDDHAATLKPAGWARGATLERLNGGARRRATERNAHARPYGRAPLAAWATLLESAGVPRFMTHVVRQCRSSGTP